MLNNDFSEIKISSSGPDYKEGIIKFETCALRNKEKIIKRSCCGTGKIEGYYCSAINKFPVSFSHDCENCILYKKTTSYH
jgi:hypothetical protein